jgi:hypothetical protein
MKDKDLVERYPYCFPDGGENVTVASAAVAVAVTVVAWPPLRRYDCGLSIYGRRSRGSLPPFLLDGLWSAPRGANYELQ